ncbi:MAG: SDR family oxidoreductase, partial [Dehalococcoidia bacterium]|nr:SDR family oxidoreductase [Dehalococcoidia bacterium]
ALVTGASRGIGKAIALELAREGVDLVIVARNQAALDETASEIAGLTGRRVIAKAADVTDRQRVDTVVNEAAAELGGLHILINSGSLPGGSPNATGAIESIVEEDFLQDFNVKYLGALRCSRAAIPHLKRAGWGRIINISGLNARKAGNLSGGARNGALVHFTRTLALQLGRHGITVNCIHPGVTRTERTADLLASRGAELGLSAEAVEASDYAEGSSRGNSIGRMIDASEIAHLAMFLCSDRSWALNGEVIAADGGGSSSVYY